MTITKTEDMPAMTRTKGEVPGESPEEIHPVFASIAQAPAASLVIAPAPAVQEAPTQTRRRPKRRQYKKLALDSIVEPEVPIVLPSLVPVTSTSPHHLSTPPVNTTTSYINDLKQLNDAPSAPRGRRRKRKSKNMATVSIPPHLRYKKSATNPAPTASNNPPPAGTTAASKGITNGVAPSDQPKQQAKQSTPAGLTQSRYAVGGAVKNVPEQPPKKDSAISLQALPTPPVSPAQPVAPPAASSPVPTPNPTTNAAAASPAKATRVPPAKANPVASATAAPASWTNTTPAQNGGAKNGSFNSPWQGRATNQGPRPRAERFPKSKAMRPPTDEESDGGVSFKSDSNGDPNHDIRKLTDWDGNWLPAPIEWEGRRGFSDRNFSSRVEGWIVKTEKSYRNLEIIDTSAPRFLSQDNGDVAPRVWIPQTIDAESPGAFWRTYQSRAPPPMSDFDPDDLPWWEKYESPTSSLLKSIEVPNAFLDREDPTYAKAQQDNGAVGAIKRREHLLKAKHARTAAKRRHQLAESKAAAAMYADHPEPPDNSLHPKGNIFVRPAYPADMEQVRDIYNHYVMHTIQSPEYEPRTRTHMVNRITDITNNHLPYIVAIDRSHKGPNSGLRHLPERIVGFANADDYCHPGSMYRFTVEMELYVHPEYSHKGVGSCLLDKLLDLLDNGYRARGGYDWYAKPDYRSDGQRVVKTVNVQVPYDHNNTYVIEWIKAWLKAFGFKAAGDMYRMGYKNNTVINVAIFQFATSEFIDPRERPSNPL